MGVFLWTFEFRSARIEARAGGPTTI